MPRKNIVQYDAPTIRQASAPWPQSDFPSARLDRLIRDLKDTMREENGVGIAAPQIGVNVRVILVETKSGPRVVINPKIIRRSWRKESGEEGCLSVRGVFGPIKRARQILVSGLDEQGRPVEYRAQGLLARIFQHELDHLAGTLIIDRLERVNTGQIDLKKWRKPV